MNHGRGVGTQLGEVPISLEKQLAKEAVATIMGKINGRFLH